MFGHVMCLVVVVVVPGVGFSGDLKSESRNNPGSGGMQTISSINFSVFLDG